MKTFSEKLQKEQKHNKQKKTNQKAKRVIRNIILSPLILISTITDKISAYNYKRMKWSEEKIKNLLYKEYDLHKNFEKQVLKNIEEARKIFQKSL